MKNAPESSRVVRFGTFRADLATGELHKNGRKIRLQEQPFRVLATLLERAGEVVAREDLRQELWSEDTFVDFDHSLSTAINKIREALGDSAANPRFVETLPRRGYRFIGPVELPRPPSQLATTEPVTPGPEDPQKLRRRVPGPLVALPILALAIGTLVGLWSGYTSSPQRSPIESL